MLRKDGTNDYINATQVAAMQPLLSQFWNNSISWTTTAGSETTLTFVGTDIVAYGIAGPQQGAYVASLNNQTVGTYSAQQSAVDYNYVLFAAHGLEDGQNHYLTLTSLDSGSLAFDVAWVTSAAFFDASSLLSTTTPTTPTATSDPLASLESVLISAEAHAAAEEAADMPHYTYTPEQLAELVIPYEFHWNSAARFVVVFGSLMGGVLLLLILWLGLQELGPRLRGKAAGNVQEGESYLITARSNRNRGDKPRPSTRILQALRGGKISAPINSTDEWSDKRSDGPPTSNTDAWSDKRSDGGITADSIEEGRDRGAREAANGPEVGTYVDYV